MKKQTNFTNTSSLASPFREGAWRSHFRKTILLAWPVCLSNVGHVMVGVVDIAMVGGIKEDVFGYSGTTAQAAVSLANGFYFLVLVFGFGVSYGVTPLAAEADSSGNINENKHLLSHALIVNVVTNGILFLFLLAMSPVLRVLHQPQDVVALAIPFLNVMMLGMIPLAVFTAFKQFAEGLSFTRFAMFITIGTNLLNVLFNWILIYGKFGFTAMGVQGSCWASFFARMLMALAMFLYLYYSKHFRKYREAFAFKDLSLQRMKKIFSIGATSGLQWVFEVSAFAIALVMIGWIGKKEQAAHQIALQLAAMTYLIASGISSAASVRVGNQLGMKNISTLREVAFSAFAMVIISQAFFAILFIAFRFLLPSIFNHEPDVQAIVSSLLLIAALFQVSDGIQIVGLGVLRVVKDITLPTWITFICYWLIGLPCCYLLAFTFGFGVQGIWYGLTIALTLAAIFLFLRFNYVTRRLQF
ncbi:MAG: MATE family efflux transporter [Bacteroidetes bacterium]|nr:MATE family efflux transporter [Bacteroidota bacterium]